MPNWVNVKMTVSGEEAEVKNFFKKHIGSDGDLDFNTIVPEPQTKDECPADCYVSANSFIASDSLRPWFDWYKWHLMFWGCKWNASSTEVVDNTIYFDTPWNDPRPILVALTKMYPSLTFDYMWVEEQGAYDTGHIIVKNNTPSLVNIPDEFSDEAYKIMFEMWGNECEYLRDIDKQEYVFIDDELRDEYDQFVADWKKDTDRVGQEPPCIEEWYNNDKKECEANA